VLYPNGTVYTLLLIGVYVYWKGATILWGVAYLVNHMVVVVWMPLYSSADRDICILERSYYFMGCSLLVESHGGGGADCPYLVYHMGVCACGWVCLCVFVCLSCSLVRSLSCFVFGLFFVFLWVSLLKLIKGTTISIARIVPQAVLIRGGSCRRSQ
jgi:hypothetical protein